ncbi:MAG TPA: hypothetical protein VI341_11100 [Actinomycetota bacterium]
MSNPMHHTLAKDRIEALLRRAELDRLAQEGRRRGTRRPPVPEPDQER